MRLVRVLVVTAFAAVVMGAAAFRHAAAQPAVASRPVDLFAQQRQAATSLTKLQRRRLAWPEERALFDLAARRAWAFVNRHYVPATGFVMPLATYPYATIWDVGSMLAAMYSARALGLVDDRVYATRVITLLQTLTRVPLYHHRIFNKAYDVRTGAMTLRGSGRRATWGGWSTNDVGRLLIWLKILNFDARFRALTEAIVQRNDLASVIRAGYLWGEDLDDQGRPREYQEGAIGYEQYAAQGFALWGHRAERALRLDQNALPISIMGQRLVADFRRWDRLTNEPFLLYGLELGWDPQMEGLTRRLLLAQEARYRRTGRLTITGEDALLDPPHYFYYYCVFADGKEFAIDTQDRAAVVDSPRWVSAKAAFAFQALIPNAYTDRAVQAVSGAGTADGWGSGIYESSGRPTGSANINTAAVILTAALVNRTGEPLLEQARAAAVE